MVERARFTSGEVLLDVGGNVLVRCDRVLVQVRAGALTNEVLRAIEVSVRGLLLTNKDAVGFLAIVEEDAPVADPDVRSKQRAVITELVNRGDTRLAVVIMGEGVGASLRRTLARTLVLANPRVSICATPSDACRVISAHTGTSAQAINETIAEARALASRRP